VTKLICKAAQILCKMSPNLFWGSDSLQSASLVRTNTVKPTSPTEPILTIPIHGDNQLISRDEPTKQGGDQRSPIGAGRKSGVVEGLSWA